MNLVLMVAASLLAASAGLVLIRMVRGPSLLDRTLALDVLVVIVIGALSLSAVHFRSNVSLPALVVLALFGFTGSVCTARFAGRGAAADADGDGVGDSAPDGDSAEDAGVNTQQGDGR